MSFGGPSFSEAAKKKEPLGPLEPISIIRETAEESRRRERKKLLSRGRKETIISGIASALKRRLGE